MKAIIELTNSQKKTNELYSIELNKITEMYKNLLTDKLSEICDKAEVFFNHGYPDWNDCNSVGIIVYHNEFRYGFNLIISTGLINLNRDNKDLDETQLSFISKIINTIKDFNLEFDSLT